ncbi:MAG TPA: hypothetical protein VFP68_01545 [Burkholderiaceae bacterium]|nr:hypothetical protein [Burkholderiaceae bacterium]
MAAHRVNLGLKVMLRTVKAGTVVPRLLMAGLLVPNLHLSVLLPGHLVLPHPILSAALPPEPSVPGTPLQSRLMGVLMRDTVTPWSTVMRQTLTAGGVTPGPSLPDRLMLNGLTPAVPRTLMAMPPPRCHL